MSSTRATQRTPQCTRKRMREKCDECRRKKSKCEPENRVWNDEEKHKCERCEKGGQTCGPNIRHPPQDHRPRSKPPLTPPSTATQTAVTCNYSFGNAEDSPSYQRAPLREQHVTEASGAANGGKVEDSPPSSRGSCGSQNDILFKRRRRIKERFLQLGNRRELFEQIESRSHAAARFEATADTLPYSHGSAPERRIFQGVREAIDHASHRVHNQFCLIFQNILDLVEEFEEDCGERLAYFLRLYGHLEAFAELLRRCSMFKNGEDSLMNALWKAVLKELITFYAREGDAAEEHRLHRVLCSLHTNADPTSSEVEAEQELIAVTHMSCRLQDVFLDLNIHQQYLQHFPISASNLFPPVHTALHIYQTSAAHFMSSQPSCDLGNVDLLSRHLLHLAAETSDYDLVEIIMRRQPELLEDRDTYQMTALCIAALHGHYELFKYLVGRGANVRARDGLGRSALCIASGAGHLQIVTYLLAEKVNPNDDILSVCSPLHAAVGGGHEEIVKVLLQNGASLDWLSNYQSPIDVASARGRGSLMKLLQDTKHERDAHRSCQPDPGGEQHASSPGSQQPSSFSSFSSPDFQVATNVPPADHAIPDTAFLASATAEPSHLVGMQAVTSSSPAVVGDLWAPPSPGFGPSPETICT